MNRFLLLLLLSVTAIPIQSGRKLSPRSHLKEKRKKQERKGLQIKVQKIISKCQKKTQDFVFNLSLVFPEIQKYDRLPNDDSFLVTFRLRPYSTLYSVSHRYNPEEFQKKSSSNLELTNKDKQNSNLEVQLKNYEALVNQYYFLYQLEILAERNKQTLSSGTLDLISAILKKNNFHIEALAIKKINKTIHSHKT